MINLDLLKKLIFKEENYDRQFYDTYRPPLRPKNDFKSLDDFMGIIEVEGKIIRYNTNIFEI